MKITGSLYLPRYQYARYIVVDGKIYNNTAAREDAPILAKIAPYRPDIVRQDKERRNERYQGV